MSYTKEDHETQRGLAENDARLQVFATALRKAKTVTDLQEILLVLCEAVFTSSPVRFEPVLVNGNSPALIQDMEGAAAGRHGSSMKRTESPRVEGDSRLVERVGNGGQNVKPDSSTRPALVNFT